METTKRTDDLEATIWCDGGCRGNGAPGSVGSAAAVVRDRDGNLLARGATYVPTTSAEAPDWVRPFYANPGEETDRPTNGMTEYLSFIQSLTIAKDLGLRRFEIVNDNQNACNQIGPAGWKVGQPRLRVLHAEVSRLIAQFDEVKITHKLRAHTFEADELGNSCMDRRESSYWTAERGELGTIPDPASLFSRDERTMLTSPPAPPPTSSKTETDLRYIQVALSAVIEEGLSRHLHSLLSEDRDEVAEAYERLLVRFERHNGLSPLPSSRLFETAKQIATEALPKAKDCAAKGIENWGPVTLNATIDGGWQIHSTSKLARVDASIQLTLQNTASVEALAAALMEGFSRKDDLAASRKSDVRESSRTR